MADKTAIDEAEWLIRRDLAAAYRLIAQFGWDDLIFTHLSARIPGDEPLFLINPYGLMFAEITAENLVKIDANGTPVGASGVETSTPGFTIHSAIHLARPDAHAVLHIHTPAGLAVSATEQGLLPLTQTALLICGDLAYHDYEGVAVDLAERARIVADLGRHNNLILRNHGLLSMGATVAEAFLRIYFLQKACEAQILVAPAERRLITPEVQRATARRGGALIPELAPAAWPALLRSITRG